MLIFQIKIIISSEKWFNYVVTTSSFFFENVKNLGRSDDAKRRKNEEAGLRLDFSRSLGGRSAGSFHEQRLVIEPSKRLCC